MSIPAHIVDRQSGQLVPAVLRGADFSDLVLWSRWARWMPVNAQDGRWKWDEYLQYADAEPNWLAAYCVEAAGDLQGLRLLEISKDDVAAYGTHMLRLSTAPWNRPPTSRFRGVGSLLVAAAIMQSLHDKHGGRAHCESLPGAEAFHRRNGMVQFDGLTSGGLKRFRFDDVTGPMFLDRMVQDGLLPGGPLGLP